jgi:hypothetical protein
MLLPFRSNWFLGVSNVFSLFYSLVAVCMRLHKISEPGRVLEGYEDVVSGIGFCSILAWPCLCCA